VNLARTCLLLAALTGLFLAVGYLVGGRSGATVAFLFALATNLFAWWGSDAMVLRMHDARPVTRESAPQLYAMVERLAARAGLPTPAVYLIQSDQPNAFATGRSPERSAVAVTTGILQALDAEELAGVVAHELAHIRNRDTLTMTLAATIAGAIGFLANFAFLLPRHSSDGRQSPLGPVGAILAMLLAPLAATLVQLAISRTREFSADRLGAEICGNPRWPARALARIEQAATGWILLSADANPATAHLFIANPLHGGGGAMLAGLFRTHPPMEARIQALLALEQEAVPAPTRGGPWGRQPGGPWG
jgi:heat shock protein HtpX